MRVLNIKLRDLFLYFVIFNVVNIILDILRVNYNSISQDWAIQDISCTISTTLVFFIAAFFISEKTND